MDKDVWQQRAALPGLSAVIDPGDRGTKNLYVDLVHRQALADASPGKGVSIVLDFGCGIGRLTSWLASRVGSAVGVDTTLEMIEAAEARIQDDRVTFMHMPDKTIPIKRGAVDAVVSVFVLQHILDDQVLAQNGEEIARVLRSGGRLAIIEQVARVRDITEGYVAHRTTDAYREVLTRAGFVLLSSRAIRSPKGWIYRVLSRRLPTPLVKLIAKVSPPVGVNFRDAPYVDELMVFERI